MDSFSSTFFTGGPGGGNNNKRQQQKQGFYHDDNGSPKQNQSNNSKQNGGQEGSPRYDNHRTSNGRASPNNNGRPQRYNEHYGQNNKYQNKRAGGQAGGREAQQPASSSRELPPRFQRKHQEHQSNGSFSPPFSESPRHGSPSGMSPQRSGEAPLGADLNSAGGEISLRPARNFQPLLKPNTPGYLPRSSQAPPQQQQHYQVSGNLFKCFCLLFVLFDKSLRPRIMGPPGGDASLDPPSLLTPKQPQVTIRAQDKPKEKKEKEKNSTEQLKEATEKVLKNFLTGTNSDEAVQAMRELKPPKRFMPQLVSHLLTLSLEYEDGDRDSVCQLLSALHKEGIVSSEVFMNGFNKIIDDMTRLESTVPLVRSFMAQFGAQAVRLGVITLLDLSEPMDHGKHHPLFLLCLQQLHKISNDEKWLVAQFTDSKIDLMAMLPGEWSMIEWSFSLILPLFFIQRLIAQKSAWSAF